MCSVVRDNQWDAYFREASRTGVQDNAEKVANSIWMFRARSIEANAGIMRAKFLLKPPPITPQASKITARCQALNMNNTPCQFKAVCGKFCKKHQIVTVP